MPLDAPWLVGATGPQGLQGIPGSPGAAGRTSQRVALQPPFASASAAATNLANNTFNAVGDPAYRSIVDLRGCSALRIMGRFGGAVSSATRLRIQYHTGGNPAVSSGDAGWTTLADSAGSHTANTMFYSAELAVPVGAQINNCLVRAGIFSGDGAADPTMTCCVLNFYSP